MRVLTVSSMVALALSVGVQEPDLTLEISDMVNAKGPVPSIDLHTFDAYGHNLSVTLNAYPNPDRPDDWLYCHSPGIRPFSDGSPRRITVADGPALFQAFDCEWNGAELEWVGGIWHFIEAAEVVVTHDVVDGNAYLRTDHYRCEPESEEYEPQPVSSRAYDCHRIVER